VGRAQTAAVERRPRQRIPVAVRGALTDRRLPLIPQPTAAASDGWSWEPVLLSIGGTLVVLAVGVAALPRVRPHRRVAGLRT